MGDSPLMRQRRSIFTVLALLYILAYFYRISLAVVADDLSRDLRLTPQQLGSLSSILFYVYAVTQLPLGPMIDRFGGRLVIGAFSVLTSIGGILFSRADTLALAMTARALIGIGTASVLMAALSIFSYWFPKRHFGRVTSYMVAVGNVGNLCATAPLAFAVAAVGWRSSFLGIGLVQILAALLVLVMVRDRPPNFQAIPEEGGNKLVETSGILSAWKDVFGNRDFRLLGLISFAWYGNYMALQGLWGGPYLMQVLRLSRQQTGQMLMFTSLGFIVGSLVNDTIARKIFRSYKQALLAGQILLLSLMSIFLMLADTLPHILLVSLFFAIGLAVSSGILIYPIIRSMFPLRIVGTALTSLNYCVLLGAAVTQQIMGVIIGSYSPVATGASPQAFRSAFMFPVIGLAAAIVRFLFARDYTEIEREADPVT